MDRVARFETFARIGFLARGVVYLLLGWLALTTAHAEGASGVLDAIGDAPAGGVLLGLMAIGLAGYAAFRLATAALDLENAGPGAKGVVRRIGWAASGLAHLVLAWIALTLAFGSGGGGEGGEREAARTAMTYPGGAALVLAVGVGFLLAGAEQLWKAWTSKFMAQLDAAAPHWVEWLGRAGYAARGVVFALIGWQLVAAATGTGEGPIGFAPALDALRDLGWGFTLVAIGLFLFGAFSLAMAMWYRICDEDVVARLKGKLS